jgi:hypothetical protein
MLMPHLNSMSLHVISLSILSHHHVQAGVVLGVEGKLGVASLAKYYGHALTLYRARAMPRRPTIQEEDLVILKEETRKESA